MIPLIPVALGVGAGAAMLLLSGCETKVGDKEYDDDTGPDTTPGTVSNEVTALYLAGDPNISSNVQSVPFAFTIEPSNQLEEVTGLLTLDPDFVQGGYAELAGGFENGILPLFAKPDETYASSTVESDPLVLANDAATYPMALWVNQVGNHSMLLYWTSMDMAATYTVTSNSTEAGVVAVTDPSQSEYSFLLEDLTADNYYTLQVTASAADGLELGTSELVPVGTHWIDDLSELIPSIPIEGSSFTVADPISNLTAGIGSTYVYAYWDDQSETKACLYRSDETEPLMCEILTNNAITFTGIPGDLAPGVEYQVKVTAYGGNAIDEAAYAAIDLNNPAFLANVSLSSIYVNSTLVDECIYMTLGDLVNNGCQLDIDTLSDGAEITGTLNVIYDGETPKAYDLYTLASGVIPLPLKLSYEGLTYDLTGGGSQ